MVYLLEIRVSKLTRISRHYRELAATLVPETLSAEIAGVADDVDDVIERLNRECLERRTSLREFSIALPDDAAPFQVEAELETLRYR